MIRASQLLLACLWLTGCQATPPEKTDWFAYTDRIDGMDPAAVRAQRESMMRQYEFEADDETRMRLGYVLSRPDPSLQQLAQGREILAEISDASDLAPLRDLLDREIALLIEIQQQRGQILELQAQLEALKAIEAEMIESRQSMEEEP